MERQQLKAIAASRGRPVGAKQTASRVDAKLRASIAARGKGRSTQAKSIEAVLGTSGRRSIIALRPNAKTRS
ncbi:MAG: hypothetical protein ACJ77D_11795 [Chloroflexota bacterium]|jgi:hypothetical protein